MGKIKDICAVCGSKKLINFARLCKRCNREKAGVKVKNVVLKDLVAKAEEAAEQKELEAKKLNVISAEFEWIPSTTVPVSDEQAEEISKLIDRLEEDEDVNKVFHNMG